MRLCFALLMAFLVSGCSLLDVLGIQHGECIPSDDYGVYFPPDNFPGYVEGMISTCGQIRLVSNEICLYVDGHRYWQPGDFWGGDEDGPAVKIAIDGVSISSIDENAVGVEIAIGDGNGQTIGQYPMEFRYCTILDLVAGTHSIEFRIGRIGDTPDVYSWDFQVP